MNTTNETPTPHAARNAFASRLIGLGWSPLNDAQWERISVVVEERAQLERELAATLAELAAEKAWRAAGESVAHQLSDALNREKAALKDLAAKDAALLAWNSWWECPTVGGGMKGGIYLASLAAISPNAGKDFMHIDDHNAMMLTQEELTKGCIPPEDVEKLRGENMTLQINLDGSKGMSRLMREQRDAWREDAMRLANRVRCREELGHTEDALVLVAHDALVAKDDPSPLAG